MMRRQSFVFFGLFATVVSIFVFVSVLGIPIAGQGRGERIRQIVRDRISDRSGLPGSEKSNEIKVNGATRTFSVHEPVGVGRTEKLPLVIVLHGGGGSGSIIANVTGFNAKADKEKFLVVYPNGSGNMGDVLLTWNAVGCCAYAAENSVNDVDFIRTLIDKMVAGYNVDAKRVYVTGHSNGAMMAYRLGVEMGDRLAAIAPVAGSIFSGTGKPKSSIPVLIIHGTADDAVPYDGGNSKRNRIKDAQKEPYRSVNDAAVFWARNNGCGLTPAKSQTGNVLKERYPGCKEKNDVEVLSIRNGQHAWPGGNKAYAGSDQPSSDLIATDAIWDFFKGRSRK